MKIAKLPAEIQQLSKDWHEQGLKVGLVPTMGYLHEGHLSLVAEAVKECDKVIMSIFVNPTQFGPKEDYATYPRDMRRDLRLAYEAGVDCVFNPEPKDMYPQGYATYVKVEQLSERLCGQSRPDHFRGVTTIVLKLFNIAHADYAYFGQKDAQQVIILEKMVRDLNLPVIIRRVPTVREADGLAKSSRNFYLSAEERVQAPGFYASLLEAKRLIDEGEDSVARITALIRERIDDISLARLDYLELVDAQNLLPLEKIQKPALMAGAVFFGKTRLIDNIFIE